MYDRYGDISKFITDADQLCVIDNEFIYISSENDYDIAVDLEGCYTSFDELKPFIAFLAAHICELDNTVQRFNRQKRVKNNGYGYVCLPSPAGILRFDYSQSMEDVPDHEQKSQGKNEFPFDLTLVYIEKPNFITLDYWCTIKNSQLDVTFEYKENQFFLRSFGAFDCIPDHWDKRNIHSGLQG